MTKAVSNMDICFNKAYVLLLCEHGHVSLNFASHGPNSPPTLQILLGLNLGKIQCEKYENPHWQIDFSLEKRVFCLLF